MRGLLIDRGGHAKEIQEWLGYSSFQVTMDVYAHLFPERQTQLADRLEDAWREVSATGRAADSAAHLLHARRD